MNQFRRLIRWLALDQITAAHDRGYRECAAITELAKHVAYAEGLSAGRVEMCEAIDRAVADRLGTGGGEVMPEDLARARRGMLH